MKKTLDYVFGFITGVSVTITFLLVCGFASGENGIIKVQLVNTQTNPLYVKIKK